MKFRATVSGFYQNGNQTVYIITSEHFSDKPNTRASLEVTSKDRLQFEHSYLLECDNDIALSHYRGRFPEVRLA